jgi:hypothetical protein
VNLNDPSGLCPPCIVFVGRIVVTQAIKYMVKKGGKEIAKKVIKKQLKRKAKPKTSKKGLKGKGKKKKKKCNKKERKKETRNRPSFRKGIVEQVWNNAKDLSGKVYDPAPVSAKYPKLELPSWKPGESRRGKWDMGHTKGNSYKSLRQKYINCKITKKKYLDTYNDPNKYKPEDPSRNRSRVFDIN